VNGAAVAASRAFLLPSLVDYRGCQQSKPDEPLHRAAPGRAPAPPVVPLPEPCLPARTNGIGMAREAWLACRRPAVAERDLGARTGRGDPGREFAVFAEPPVLVLRIRGNLRGTLGPPATALARQRGRRLQGHDLRIRPARAMPGGAAGVSDGRAGTPVLRNLPNAQHGSVA
jgi:hypothetical protein